MDDEALGVRPAHQSAFTLKQNPLRREHLDDLVSCYAPRRRHQRVEADRFRAYDYDDLVARDKANLDLTWLRDESLEDLDNLPAPEVIAREIVEDLTAALAEFEAFVTEVKQTDDHHNSTTTKPAGDPPGILCRLQPVVTERVGVMLTASTAEHPRAQTGRRHARGRTR